VKDTLVIVNPASGDGDTGRAWPLVAARLREAGLDFDYALTDRPAHATELAREAVRAGCGTVVAAGGDGTVNEVANGFFSGGEAIPGRARLGVVPLGTGGDFRRTFDIPRDVAAAARVLLEGRERVIDAGRATYVGPGGAPEAAHFVNIADVGIGGEVVRQVKRGPRLVSGAVTFTVATGVTALRWRNRPMHVVVDGEAYDLVAQQVVVANCQYYGGGMRIAPRAEPGDGWFDVLLVGDMSLVDNLRFAGPMRRGAHLDRPMAKLLYRRARRVEISSPRPALVDLDGELPGVLPATLELLPGALRLLAP
jgi:diacylglycerol kinase (ATP)